MAIEKDPVCGMQIDESDAVGQSEFGGRTFIFCSETCKTKFDENPAQFAADRGKSAQGNF
jgi:P-type Cu+ transporter